MLTRRLILVFIIFINPSAFAQLTTEIAKKGIGSTVAIVTMNDKQEPFMLGSGFIIDDNLIATNAHVIEGCSSAYIMKNNEDKKYDVLGYVALDKQNDLAILKTSDLKGDKLLLSEERIPEIGEKIFAIGTPEGFTGTFSEGIVSGIREKEPYQILQITAPISSGSSGGPVLNSAGVVVGVAFASQKIGQSLNFAVPVKYLLKLMNDIDKVQSFNTNKKIVSPPYWGYDEQIHPLVEAKIKAWLKNPHGNYTSVDFIGIESDDRIPFGFENTPIGRKLKDSLNILMATYMAYSDVLTAEKASPVLPRDSIMEKERAEEIKEKFQVSYYNYVDLNARVTSQELLYNKNYLVGHRITVSISRTYATFNETINSILYFYFADDYSEIFSVHPKK